MANGAWSMIVLSGVLTVAGCGGDSGDPGNNPFVTPSNSTVSTAGGTPVNSSDNPNPAPGTTTPPINTPAPSGNTLFPVQAVLTTVATSGITFTANYTDTQGNSFELSDALLRGNDTVFEGATRRAYTDTINVKRNGSLVSSVADQLFFSTPPLQFYGVVGQGGLYTVVTTATTLPATAKAGETGNVYAATSYSASDKRTAVAGRQLKWSVEADTTTTAFVCTSTINNLPSGTVTDTRKVCYKVNTSGNLLGYRFQLDQGGTTIVFG